MNVGGFNAIPWNTDAPSLNSRNDILSRAGRTSILKNGPPSGRGGGGELAVDDVLDFFVCLRAMDDPVVSVEWRLSAT